MTQKITIESFPPDRGRKKILVDGEHWGTIDMYGHGCHGHSYSFKQVGSFGILMESSKYNPESDIEVKVWSEKHRARRDNDKRPTEVALLDKARELVASGKLLAPAIVKAETEKAVRVWREREEKAKAKARQRDVAVGLKIVEQFNGIRWHTDEGKKLIADAIADAIEHGRGE